MDTETRFCIKRLVEIAMQRNVKTAIFELKSAILHVERAQGLVGKLHNPHIDYDPAKKCLKQLVALLETSPEEYSEE